MKNILKPISYMQTLLLFFVPALIFSLSLLVLLPFLVREGWSPFVIFNVCFMGPCGLLLAAALVGAKLEGSSWTWKSLRQRFRLGKLPRHAWIWILGLCMFNWFSGMIAQWVLVKNPSLLPLFTWPSEFASFMQNITTTKTEFLGISLQGQWWVFFYFGASLFIFNILGEELWWRGYILPRQELAQGRWTWVIHGVLWDLFHVFYHQDLSGILAYLPMTLAIAFVSQKLKNSWPAIISHTLTNSPVWFLILKGILNHQ